MFLCTMNLLLIFLHPSHPLQPHLVSGGWPVQTTSTCFLALLLPVGFGQWRPFGRRWWEEKAIYSPGSFPKFSLPSRWPLWLFPCEFWVTLHPLIPLGPKIVTTFLLLSLGYCTLWGAVLYILFILINSPFSKSSWNYSPNVHIPYIPCHVTVGGCHGSSKVLADNTVMFFFKFFWKKRIIYHLTSKRTC